MSKLRKLEICLAVSKKIFRITSMDGEKNSFSDSQQGNKALSVKKWDNGPSRRHIVKCAGGASAATIVAWHGLRTEAMAGGQNPGGSGGSGF